MIIEKEFDSMDEVNKFIDEVLIPLKCIINIQTVHYKHNVKSAKSIIHAINNKIKYRTVKYILFYYKLS